jgi:putative endonuclease
MSQKIGFAAENRARNHLTDHGLRWITSNYRCRLGEIDLIMRDGDYLVFVEVRARAANTYGNALESVTWHKRQKLIKTAMFYLQTYKIQDKFCSRFDIVSIDGMQPSITWIKNAFEI